jgi:hypothetical protein
MSFFMTTNSPPGHHQPRPRRRITTTTLVIVAAATIATGALGSASPANAEPKQKPGATDFYNCVDAKIRSIDNANGGHTWQDMIDARQDCCAHFGGQWVPDDHTKPDGNGMCAMPDGSVVKPNGPTAPLPGTTAIIPPDRNTRISVQ